MCTQQNLYPRFSRRLERVFLLQHKSFHKRLAKALQLDSATADIIAGDFAEDALLLKAEQLAKREVGEGRGGEGRGGRG